MSVHISIVVCCYNSSKRITDTLKHILNQDADGIFEIIVVNNNSVDDTRGVAEKVLGSSVRAIPFKVVDEPRPGLSYARERGFSESKGEVILMVDDDNHLDTGYIRLVDELMESDSSIGILGGLSSAVYEQKVPDWFRDMDNVLAVGQPWGVEDGAFVEASAVYGAGMSIRRQVLVSIKQAGFESQLTDRKGKNLSSGGDTEICMAARMAGHRVVFCNRLRFRHIISADRLDWPYMRRLYEGFGRAKAYIDIYEHFLAGRPMPPANSRLPYWADRLIHLAKELFGKDKRLSLFSALTDSGERAVRLATWAHLALMKEILFNRARYMQSWIVIGSFQQRLKDLR